MRPEPGTAERDWTWQARPPELPTGTSVGEFIRARLLSVGGGHRRLQPDSSVAVLREGLRLAPSQLTLLPVDEEPDEEEPDGAWDQDRVDVG